MSSPLSPLPTCDGTCDLPPASIGMSLYGDADAPLTLFIASPLQMRVWRHLLTSFL